MRHHPPSCRCRMCLKYNCAQALNSSLPEVVEQRAVRLASEARLPPHFLKSKKAVLWRSANHLYLHRGNAKYTPNLCFQGFLAAEVKAGK